MPLNTSDAAKPSHQHNTTRVPRPDKDPAISTDAFFGNLTRIRNVILPRPARNLLNTGRGLLGGFIVVHLVFLVFAASLSLRGEAFSDTFIYRDWAMAGFNDANLTGGPSPWVYPILALIPMAIAGIAGRDRSSSSGS
jgi:hypothetical protein